MEDTFFEDEQNYVMGCSKSLLTLTNSLVFITGAVVLTNRIHLTYRGRAVSFRMQHIGLEHVKVRQNRSGRCEEESRLFEAIFYMQDRLNQLGELGGRLGQQNLGEEVKK
jgi:hypothetical protein